MSQAATVRSLQQRIAEMQPLRVSDDLLPTAPALRGLLPSGGLRKGAAATVQGSRQLALAMLTEVSASGGWCGVIGMPSLGFEAAAQLGIALERFVVVPDPGRHTLGVAGMLSEVLDAMVVQSSTPPRPAELERLMAKLREHSTALVALSEWPRSETTLRVTESHWSGLGTGHGLLDTQLLTVCSYDRRGQRTHRVCFSGGRLAAAPRLEAVAS